LIINFDLGKFLKDNNIADGINKLQKEDLYDPQLFFKVDIGTIETVLDIKPEGKKLKLMNKIKELREKLEKEGSISYIDTGFLEHAASPNTLKFTKSHSIIPKKINLWCIPGI